MILCMFSFTIPICLNKQDEKHEYKLNVIINHLTCFIIRSYLCRFVNVRSNTGISNTKLSERLTRLSYRILKRIFLMNDKCQRCSSTHTGRLADRDIERLPSFHLGDNYVHLHECSPFWVGIFIIFCKENYFVYCLM